MSTAAEARIFEFGGFLLDAAKRQLSAVDGKPIPLPSRAFDLLLFMVERPGEILEKSTIMNAVWPKSVVEEGNLTQCIYALRRALGEPASDHRFIATLPGRGYQFVAKVQAVADEPLVQAPASAVVPTRKRTAYRWMGVTMAVAAASAGYLLWPGADSGLVTTRANPAPIASNIAVLPFVDLSPSKDMEYFADGIAEELTTSLAKVGELRVVGRRSAFSFKGKDADAKSIGEKLNAATILEGSVRKEDERIRISAQLTRAEDGIVLWTQSYDRKLDDVLDLQGSIAREVVNALEPTLLQANGTSVAALGARLTDNADAYKAYLRGVYFHSRATAADASRAGDEFDRAIKQDPKFALAYAWRARIYSNQVRFGRGDAVKNRSAAISTLDKALQIDPSIGDIWWVSTQIARADDAPLSLRAGDLQRALAATPGDTEAMVQLGAVYFQQGRRAEAFEILERAHALDPLWARATTFLGMNVYSYQGDAERTLALAREAQDLAPTNPSGPILSSFVEFNRGRALEWDHWVTAAVSAAPRDTFAHDFLSTDYGDLGILDAALHHARMSRLLDPENAGGWFRAAHALLISGKPAEARKYVDEAISRMPGDYQAQLALAELQYFSGDCAASAQSFIRARPGLDQPVAALSLLGEVEWAPTLAWCLHATGNDNRAREIAGVLDRVLTPPLCPGLYDGPQARMAAAIGDRNSLVTHLAIMVKTNTMQFAFVRHEPMIQPYLKDPEVVALLDKLEERRAEWRRIVPKSSMRVPIPGVVAAN